MGLTIHYSGSFNKDTSLPEMIAEVRDIAEIYQWKYHIEEEQFPKNSLGKSGYSKFKHIKPALIFFILYWPVIILASLLGMAIGWNGGPSNFWEWILYYCVKLFYPIPSIGLIGNSLIVTLAIFIITWLYFKLQLKKEDE